MRKIRLASFALASSSILVLATAAAAQQATTTESPAQNVPQTNTATATQAPDTNSVEEVVVTAQKRVENVQKVPVAVTVVGADQLARQNIETINDLSRAAPALEVQNIPGQGGGPSIRGIGTEAVSLTSENAVSLVVDGVVLGRAGLSSLFDISRVEVLRGPQGMLFGKNASAGVLNITTNAPDPSKWEVIGHADIGAQYGYGVYQLTVNAPLSSTAALRISGHINNEDGLIHNLTTGQDSRNFDAGVRARLLWEPTDRLTVNLIADYDRNPTKNEFLEWNSFGASAYALPGVLAACGVTASIGNRDTCPNGPINTTTMNSGISAQIDYRIGDYTLTSITADRESDSHGSTDIDSTPIDLLQSTSSGGSNTFSQEIRLTSPATQRVEFVAGAYYSNTRLSQDSFGLGTVPLIAFGPVVIVPPIDSHSYGQATLESVAAFGQATFHVTDRFRLIAGGRGTYDSLSTTSLDEVANLTTEGRTHQADFSYRLGAQFDLAPRIMAYATYSRGYKGPQVNLPSAGVPESIVSPEVPIAYEVGLKASVFDNRLAVDLNGFYTTVHDFQTQVLENTAIGPQFVIGNVPYVKTKGIELDIFGRPFQGLTINGGAIYNPATYGPFTAQNISLEYVDVQGDQLAFTPRWKFTLSTEYAHPLSDSVEGFIQADLVYKSKINFDAAPDPETTLDHQFLLGGRVGVRSPDGRWGVSVYGRNLLDNRYPANIQVGPLENFIGGLNGGVPSTAHVLSLESFRTVGVSLDGKF